MPANLAYYPKLSQNDAKTVKLLKFVTGSLALTLALAADAQFTYTTNGDGTLTITGGCLFCYQMVVPSTINGLLVTRIGTNAFYANTNLTSVVIPVSVTEIGASSLRECPKLVSVTIGNGVISIGNAAFSDCQSLSNVVMGSSVADVEDWAFNFCLGLTNISFPASLTNIGSGAFNENWSLKTITIPKSVISIGPSAFSYCHGLTAINVDALNPNYSSLDGVLFDKGQTTLIQFPTGLGGSYVVPNSVIKIGIGEGAFGFSSLTNVIIGTNVTDIGPSAFIECQSLGSVTIPSSVTNIEGNAFNGCSSLGNFTIPDSVTSIGASAFLYCLSLTNINIPRNVATLGNALNPVFYQCNDLTSITVDPQNPYFISLNGALYNKNLTTLIQYPAARTGSMAIPDSVTNIGTWAFNNCINLTSLIIPGRVTVIGDSAFTGCSMLTNIYFEGNAPNIGPSELFYRDNYLTVYYLPGNSGWGPIFSGRPTAPWLLPYPQILDNGLGVQGNQFGFKVSWATNATVVVEASVGVNNPKWTPVTTNILSGGTFYFNDPKWTNYTSRFYRVRSQ